MFTTLLSLVVMAPAKIGVISTFAPTDPAWVAEYESSTGRQVVQVKNHYATGECTWMAQALRRDNFAKLGCHDAYTWFAACQKGGYATGPTPKPLAIAVWNKTIGGGHGHVATVTGLYPDGLVGVWDANWSSSLDHKVRFRIIDPKKEKGLTGFIYWSNHQSESPDGPSNGTFKPDATFQALPAVVEARYQDWPFIFKLRNNGSAKLMIKAVEMLEFDANGDQYGTRWYRPNLPADELFPTTNFVWNKELYGGQDVEADVFGYADENRSRIDTASPTRQRQSCLLVAIVENERHQTARLTSRVTFRYRGTAPAEAKIPAAYR